MNLIRTNAPDALQTANLSFLQDTCNKLDHISITFPLEEDCICYLLYENDCLLSALITFFRDCETMECYACTLPTHRRNGHFTQLLDELVNDYPDIELVFPVYDNCPDTANTLKALEATFWYQEHFMELTITRLKKSGFLKEDVDLNTITITSKRDDLNNQICYQFTKDQMLIGTCYLEIQKDCAYFYGFEISEPVRGQGLGGECLSLFLTHYVSMPENKERIYLQVSGQNLPAMTLYKKAGFIIQESLSYYLY